MEFSEDDKYNIWMDYVVTQIALKYNFEFLDNHEWLEERLNYPYKKYPILNVVAKQLWLDIKIRNFDDFCNEKDDRVSEGLKGWYWRFKDRIFK